MMKHTPFRAFIPLLLSTLLFTGCDDLALGFYPEFKAGICSVAVHVKVGDAIAARGDFADTSIMIGIYKIDRTVYSGNNPYESDIGATPKLQEYQAVKGSKEFDVVFEHKPEESYQVFVWYELNKQQDPGVDPQPDFAEPSVLALNRADGRTIFDFSRKGAPAAYEADAVIGAADTRIDKDILMALDQNSRIVYIDVKVSDAVKAACEVDGSPIMVALVPLKETDLDWGTLDIGSMETKAFYVADFSGENKNLIGAYFVPVPDGRYYVFTWRDALNNVPLSLTKDQFENRLLPIVSDPARRNLIRNDYVFNSTEGLYKLTEAVAKDETLATALRLALTDSGWRYGDLRPNYKESSLLLAHVYNEWSSETRIRVSSSGSKAYQVEGTLTINSTTDFTKQFNSEVKNLEVYANVGAMMRRWLYSIKDIYDPNTFQPILYSALVDVTDSTPLLIMKSFTSDFVWGRSFNFPLKSYRKYKAIVWVEVKGASDGIPQSSEIMAMAETNWDDQSSDDETIIGRIDINQSAGARLSYADRLTDAEYAAVFGAIQGTTYRNDTYTQAQNQEFFGKFYKPASTIQMDGSTRLLMDQNEYSSGDWNVYEAGLDRLFYILQNLNTSSTDYPSGKFTETNLGSHVTFIQSVAW